MVVSNNKNNDDNDLSDHQPEQNRQPEHPHTVPQELSKSLVQFFPPPYVSCTKRVSTDAASAVSEVLRLFVVEAHARASVEVSRMEFRGIGRNDVMIRFMALADILPNCPTYCSFDTYRITLSQQGRM
jgi:hypothetical protein